MLQNARVTAFTVLELLRENQQEGGGGDEITLHTHTHTHALRLGLMLSFIYCGSLPSIITSYARLMETEVIVNCSLGKFPPELMKIENKVLRL